MPDREKPLLIYIHGGMTFSNKEDYIKYLEEKKVTIDDFSYWAYDYLEDQTKGKYRFIRPKMPCKENAKYEEWKIVFEKYLPYIDERSILVGSSLGGIFLAKYLSENKLQIPVHAVYFVAPPFDNSLTGVELVGGFELGEHLELIKENAKHIEFFFSKDDSVVPVDHAKKYQEKLPKIPMHILEGKNGHFIVEEFPELVKSILQENN